MKKSKTRWQEQLTPEQYHVCREGATEPPFSGEHYARNEPGVYHCICCKSRLFDSDSKYDSGSGWPSYTNPVTESAICILRDDSHGMIRSEVRCAECNAHLGHVFPDGPAPYGLRYCINSIALSFEPAVK